MGVEKQIDDYIASQPEPKQREMRALHKAILQLAPKGKLWFLDGRDGNGRVVSNPGGGSMIGPPHGTKE